MAQQLVRYVAELAGSLTARGERLATAESCTGGWVAKACTDLAGSSDWFDRGFVTYSNESKCDMLGVSAGTLDAYGAVSEQTVCEMASGALARSNAHWALAISGIAGPAGGSPDKPVGSVWFAWAGPGDWRCSRLCHFDGDRDAVRSQAVATAIRVLVERVQGTAVNGDGEVRHRLFLALWPDDETRARLAQAARQLTRHPVPDANLHMTLHFLGGCTLAEQDCYINVVSGISFESFEIIIDSVGGRSRSGIQWLSASRSPQALERLVADLGGALETCGYQPEKRRFLPHVTISRRARRPHTQIGLEPLHWRVREFALVESLAVPGGVRYEVRARRACAG